MGRSDPSSVSFADTFSRKGRRKQPQSAAAMKGRPRRLPAESMP